MNTYQILFSGRRDGAIGAFERLTVDVNAESIHSDAIIPALRERGYETNHLVCRTLLRKLPGNHGHDRDDKMTCGNCNRSWCGHCDPCPSALCHFCHGIGYSDHELTT